VKLRGSHCVQEHSPDAIGEALRAFAIGLDGTESNATNDEE